MKKNFKLVLSLILVMVFASVAIFEHEADARAGGSRSSGSSGSRSYSAPKRSTSSPATPSQPSSSSSAPAPVRQQPAGGGFLRGMAGGLVGGLLGGMLFSSLGFGGTGGFGGSGVGLLEILLLCGIGFFIYSIVKKRREAAMAYQSSSPQGNYTEQRFEPYGSGPVQTIEDPITQGISYIRQMDPGFTEAKFTDAAMDLFFRIQGAWTSRDIAAMKNLLTDEMSGIFKQDIDALLREKKINRLENIAVRKVEIVEAWQETGGDYIKAVFTANLLDYDTDEATGKVLAGSKTEPVKFEECWTFTRPVGDNPWKLSAISQM